MTMGYTEEAADAFVFGEAVAPLGYPTPNFGPEVNEMIKNSNSKRKEKAATNFSEDVEADMAIGRIDVMRGRLDELATKLGMLAELGEVEMDIWMHDKLTLAADYISAVADAAMYGGGVEVEPEEEEGPGYGEAYNKGLTKKEQKSQKNTAKRRMADKSKSADKAFAPFPSDKAFNKRNEGKDQPESASTKAYKDKFGDTSDNSEKKADKDYDGDGKIESGSDEYLGARDNAIKKKKKAEEAGIKFSEFKEKTKTGLAAKAEKSGIPIGILRSVYAKGMAAWKSGHRPGQPPQAWAMARVNSFITGSGGARKADADLWKRASAAKKNKGK